MWILKSWGKRDCFSDIPMELFKKGTQSIMSGVSFYSRNTFDVKVCVFGKADYFQFVSLECLCVIFVPGKNGFFV